MLKTIQGVPQINSESFGAPHMFLGVADSARLERDEVGRPFTAAARASSTVGAKDSIVKE